MDSEEGSEQLHPLVCPFGETEGAVGYVAGRWRGAIVAVKIVAHDCSLASLAETLRESALSTSIQHPNVVCACLTATKILLPCKMLSPIPLGISGTARWHHALVVSLSLPSDVSTFKKPRRDVPHETAAPTTLERP